MQRFKKLHCFLRRLMYIWSAGTSWGIGDECGCCGFRIWFSLQIGSLVYSRDVIIETTYVAGCSVAGSLWPVRAVVKRIDPTPSCLLWMPKRCPAVVLHPADPGREREGVGGWGQGW